MKLMVMGMIVGVLVLSFLAGLAIGVQLYKPRQPIVARPTFDI